MTVGMEYAGSVLACSMHRFLGTIRAGDRGWHAVCIESAFTIPLRNGLEFPVSGVESGEKAIRWKDFGNPDTLVRGVMADRTVGDPGAK